MARIRMKFMLCLLLSLCAASAALLLAQEPTIDTVAGGGPDGVPALQADLIWPTAVTFDAQGTLYLTAWHRVYKVDAAGVIHAVAGIGGNRGFGGDGLPALNGNLYYPGGILFDDAGNLLIADTWNGRVRRVDAVSGIITTVAGGGSGNPGEGGQATSARLGLPVGLAADAAGNVFFADAHYHRVRRVDAATGTITTVAGTGECGFTGNGGPGTSAQLCDPTYLALDRSAGILYIADTINNAIRKLDLGSGTITAVTGLPRAAGLALDAAAGFLYFSSLSDGKVYRLHLPTGGVTFVAGPFQLDMDPSGGGLALDGAGHLFVAEPWGYRVHRIALSTGQVVPIAGNGTSVSQDGFLAEQTSFQFPESAAVDGSGDLFISEGRVRRVDAVTGLVSTLMGIPEGGGAEAPVGTGALFMDGADNLYIGSTRVLRRDGITGVLSVVAGTGDFGFSGDGGLATAADLSVVTGGVLDGAGNLYIADYDNYRVRRVDAATGIITTVAGNGQYEYSGDGGPATSAGMSPNDVALDGQGNLYISDGYNHRIRKVDAATGLISTVAGTGVNGTAGDGGSATAAQLRSPGGISVDGAGNILITDLSYRVRRVDAASGIITTLAGSGAPGFAGDGGPALAARFDYATDVFEDQAGDLYVVDTFNFRIRKMSFPPNSPPVAAAGADVDLGCASASGATVSLDGSGSSDLDSTAGTNDDIVSFEWFEDYGGMDQTLLGSTETLQVTLPLGSHLITLRVTDAAGLSDTDEVLVSVAMDTTPPALSVVMSPKVLSPHPRRFVPVHAAVSASDGCGAVSVVLVGVTSNESGLPGGVVPASDIRDADFGTADFDFELRAWRLGSGSGRIYTVTYRATDSSGNHVLSSDTVVVSHHRGGSGGTQPGTIKGRPRSGPPAGR